MRRTLGPKHKWQLINSSLKFFIAIKFARNSLVFYTGNCFISVTKDDFDVNSTVNSDPLCLVVIAVTHNVDLIVQEWFKVLSLVAQFLILIFLLPFNNNVLRIRFLN